MSETSTDIVETMWKELAEYQPRADADGHGDTWRRMCEERKAASAVNAAAEAGTAGGETRLPEAVGRAAFAAAHMAGAWSAEARRGWAKTALEHIRKAKEAAR